ncbi:hypothetical protein, partial [Streptomyces sp. 039-1]|uniref:hypothetical protein n=1 Tax=Streptomyces sp. 039-1 TaxID=2789263 RepID=UPI0039F4AD01
MSQAQLDRAADAYQREQETLLTKIADWFSALWGDADASNLGRISNEYISTVRAESKTAGQSAREYHNKTRRIALGAGPLAQSVWTDPAPSEEVVRKSFWQLVEPLETGR